MAYAWREAITGNHPLRSVIGTYDSVRSAIKTMNKLDPDGLVGLFRRHFREISHHPTRNGVLVVDDVGPVPQSGITGEYEAYWMGKVGFVRRPIPRDALFFEVV